MQKVKQLTRQPSMNTTSGQSVAVSCNYTCERSTLLFTFVSEPFAVALFILNSSHSGVLKVLLYIWS